MQKKTNTLKKYIVTSHGVNFSSPTLELGQHITHLMSDNAAYGILMQCGLIPALYITDLKLPPSNLKAEGNSVEFDWGAANVAKCRKFKFTAKWIRNNVMSSKRNNGKVEAHETFKYMRNKMEREEENKSRRENWIKIKESMKTKELYKNIFEGSQDMVKAIQIRRRNDQANEIKTRQRKIY